MRILSCAINPRTSELTACRRRQQTHCAVHRGYHLLLYVGRMLTVLTNLFRERQRRENVVSLGTFLLSCVDPPHRRLLGEGFQRGIHERRQMRQAESQCGCRLGCREEEQLALARLKVRDRG